MFQLRKVGSHVRRWLGKSLGRRCVLCLEPSLDTNLCRYCAASVPVLGRACFRCALPLPADEPHDVCGACLTHSPPWHRATAAARYVSPVSEMISAFKFGRDLAVGQALADLLFAQVKDRSLDTGFELLPVPLHRARLRERGFNQSLELARSLSRKLDMPVATRLLRRSRATVSQSGTATQSQRLKNVRGAFELTGPPPESVVLLDDVYTTGATLRACADLLVRGGCRNIEVWVVARTDQPVAPRSQ